MQCSWCKRQPQSFGHEHTRSEKDGALERGGRTLKGTKSLSDVRVDLGKARFRAP